MARRRDGRRFLTLEHQFELAEEALFEARNRLKAHWYASSIDNSFQVAHRAAAGLLFGIGAKIFTEKEVRYGFSVRFVESGQVPATALDDYDFLDAARKTATFDHDHQSTAEEAERALQAAERFWGLSQELKAEIPKV